MGLDQEMNSLSGDGKSYYWRKHARLQQFMAKQWEKQNPNKQPEGSFNLGFNAGDVPVKITKELLDEWQKQVKEYKNQDQEACDWAKAMLEKGESVVYTCSW
jgi:hypothetical protein